MKNIYLSLSFLLLSHFSFAQNVGIGTAAPSQKLDVNGKTLIRGGGTFASTSGTQVLFGFGGTADYQHAIKTRHHSGQAASNAIDFYVWNYGVDDIDDEPTKQVMSIDGRGSGSVGIGTPTPQAKLHINGSVRFQGLGSGAQTTALMLDGSGNLSTREMNIANWDAAFSWGNHASAGYLTSFSETDPTWSGNANTTDDISRTGNVGIGVGTNANAKLNVGGRISMNDNEIRLRGPADPNHILSHKSTFASASMDGPLLMGHSSGVLGTNLGGDKISLFWNNNQQVGIGTAAPSERLHVIGSTAGDYFTYNSTGISVYNAETSTGEVRLGAAWNRPGVYASNGLNLFTASGHSIQLGINNTTYATMESSGVLNFQKGVLFDCNDCGSQSTINGTDNYGDLVVQGRVLSGSSNIHLSPPSGSNVVINDDYRAAGGVSTGTAGLQVESLGGTGEQRLVRTSSNGTLAADVQFVYGNIDSDGFVQSESRGLGSGFGNVNIRATGIFRVTFANAFIGRPVCTCSQYFPNSGSNWFLDQGNGGSTLDNALIVGVTNEWIDIKTGDGSGNASNRSFSIQCIGAR